MHVVSSATQNGLSVKAAGNTGTFPFRVTWASGTEGDMLCVNDSGNVGIGTTSPGLGGARTYSKVLTIDGGVSASLENTGAAELGGSTDVNDRLVGSLAFFNRDNTGSTGATRQQVGLIETICVTSNSNVNNDSGGTLVFLTKAEAGFVTEKMRLDSTGNLTISNGNLIVGTAGKGIDFSADPSAAGMTSELLDDYEEGTWTPSVSAAVGTITTVGAVSGFYTKIGNLVTVSMSIAITTNGTGASSIVVSNPPFTAINNQCNGSGSENNSTGKMINASIIPASSIFLSYYDATYPAFSGALLKATLTYQA